MRVAIVGAGGLGCYFGALLARAGNDVTLVTRTSQVEMLRERGLTLHSGVHGDITAHVEASDTCAAVGAVDLLMVCVKTYDVLSAARHARPLVGADTLVVPVQNGVESPQVLGSVFGPEPVVGGTTVVNAHRIAPGVVRHSGGESLLIGEVAGGTSERTRHVAEVFQAAGIAAQAHPNISEAIWLKFAGICGAAVTALVRLPVGPVLACPETRAFVTLAAGEVVAVARSVRVMLPPTYADEVVVRLGAYPVWAKPSLLVDLEEGRRLELDALAGAVVRLGHEHGVATPANTAVYAALKPYIDGAPSIPTHNT